MTGGVRHGPIGLQLYSVRGECQRDLAAALQEIARIGYAAVEPWGYAGDRMEWLGHPVDHVRGLLDETGLACCGLHLATAALQGDNLERTVRFCQALGTRYLIIAADRERMSVRQRIGELAELLNHVAGVLAPLGLCTGYHAHGFDFARFDGQTAWEILFSSTRPEVVMQLDIGNCAEGGGDPVAMLERFPGRARSVHLKDHDAPPDGVIGEGRADWARIFSLCDALHRPEWYVVEEGGADGTGFDVSTRSLQALQRMGR